MDWECFVGVDWATLIDWLSNDINNSSKSSWSDWDSNWGTSVLDSLTSDETLSGVQSDGTDIVSSQMLGYFKNQSVLSIFDFESVENWWEFTGELYIDDSTNNLRDFTSSSCSAKCS